MAERQVAAQAERARHERLPAPAPAGLAVDAATADGISVALGGRLNTPAPDGGTLQRQRASLQRLPSPALRQGFVASIGRQHGNAHLQRVIAGQSWPPVSRSLGLADTMQRASDPNASATTAEPDSLIALVNLIVNLAAAQAVHLLLSFGVRDENKLTNLLFWASHPDMVGQKIKSSQKDLARDWVGIRDRFVRPALEARAPDEPAGGGAVPTGPTAGEPVSGGGVLTSPTAGEPAGGGAVPTGPTASVPADQQDPQLAAFVAGLNNPAATAAVNDLAALEQRYRAVERENTEEKGAGRDELVAGIAALRAKIDALDSAGLAPAALAELKKRLYRGLNAISPFYSQGRNIDLLEGKKQAEKLGTKTSVVTRTCNITSLSMALEAMGKSARDYDSNKRDEVAAAARVFNAEARSATLTVAGDGTAWGKMEGLRLSDFMQLAAIAEALGSGKASDAAVTSAAVSAWDKILSIYFLKQLAERFGVKGTVKAFTLDPAADAKKQKQDLSALSGWGAKHRTAVEKMVDARNNMEAATGAKRENWRKKHEQALTSLRSATNKSKIEDKLPLESYRQAMTAQIGAELDSGAAVVVAITGHYVRLQALFDDHVIVDDPAQLARANRKVTWEEARAMGYFKHRLVLQG